MEWGGEEGADTHPKWGFNFPPHPLHHAFSTPSHRSTTSRLIKVFGVISPTLGKTNVEKNCWEEGTEGGE